MNREEAIAHGMEVHETKHSMKRRCPWHDYRKKGTYMLTLVVEGRVPLLGELKGNAEAPLESPDAPCVEYSELGNAILRDEICKINKFYSQVEIWKVCIMPDHIHMIVRVKEYLPEKNHLGMVVRGFETGCSRAWWHVQNLVEKPQERWLEAATVPSVSPEGHRPVLFEEGYNDKILMHEGQLDNWKPLPQMQHS